MVFHISCSGSYHRSRGVTNTTFSLPYTSGNGTYTNGATDYAIGGDAIYLALTNANLVSSAVVTNTYTNALFSGTFTNIATNVTTRLRLISNGYPKSP